MRHTPVTTIVRDICGLAVLLVVTACSGKSVQPGDFALFNSTTVGEQIAPICTEANAGNRYTLDGVMKLPNSSSISDGKTTLDFYQKLNADKEGAGPAVQVEVKTPGDINDIWKTAEGVKGKGYNTQEGSISEDALVIHTTSGDAKAGDPLRLTVEIDVITNFQSKAVSGCTYKFVSAEKRS
jgi:hypothetical protein